MTNLLKWDGHTHTQFCRHGNPAVMEDYIERAVAQGFERYTISEHPPLPAGWVDNKALMRELAMDEDELPDYLSAVEKAKAQYVDKLEVTVGLELDYLDGRTSYTEAILERWGGRLEDVLVSVHFLPGRGGIRCIDYTPEDFREGLLDYYGSMDTVVDVYYDHVEKAIEWASGLPMRKRLGHINLIEKFRKALPPLDEAQMNRRLEKIIPLLLQHNVGLDVNTAGFRVKTIGTPYIPDWFLYRCREAGIPLVFGSDAHKPADAGAGWEWYAERMTY
jgi:histidinol-phosphatase (PHP family)